MAIIVPEHTHDFKSAASLYGKVRRFLSKYASTNLIDEGEFPTYIKEVLRLLGVGVLKENDAVIRINNFKGVIPEDFSILYAAYKCSPTFNSKTFVHPQGGASVYHDVTWELLQGDKNCEINCVCQNDSRVLEKITFKTFVQEEPVTGSFTNPVLLTLSPNVKKKMCTEDCENLFATSPFEFTLDNGHIYTNFTDDFVYIKYWSLATDENGIPLIPDLEETEKALEWYIIFQTLLKWWVNNQVPDLEKRLKYVEDKYNDFFTQAYNERKFPSFSRVVSLIRRKRKINKVSLFRQSGGGTWQYC